jgi:hypothetical protein
VPDVQAVSEGWLKGITPRFCLLFLLGLFGFCFAAAFLCMGIVFGVQAWAG